MPWDIDGSLYPDITPPEKLESLEEKIEFLARLFSAWDFGILPEPDILAEISKPHWQEAVEACQLLTSPTYHMLRKWHNLKPLIYLGDRLAYIQNDPWLKFV